MQVIKLADRELSGPEQYAVEKFSYYVDQKGAIAIIGDYAAVLSKDIHTKEAMVAYAQKGMQAVTNTHPDFNSYIMDDGNVMVEMGNGAVYSVLEGKENGLKPTDKQAPIDIALKARGYCLEAADRGIITAVVLFQETGV